MRNMWTDEEIKWMYDTTCALASQFREANSQQRDDYVQSAMIKALRKRDGKLPTRKWLYMTVRSVVIDAARYADRRCKQLTIPLDDSLCHQAEYVARGAEVEKSAQLDSIAKTEVLLRDLSKAHHDALALRSQGWSYKQIADKTGAPIGTVRSRLHYAKKRAKQLSQRISLMRA